MKLALSLGEAAEFVSDSAGKLFCFDGDTPLFKYEKVICKIKDINVGDILDTGETVIAKQKFLNNK